MKIGRVEKSASWDSIEVHTAHMDQHPVPQNISSYEFRLIGDMTLKQFFQLAGGAGLALIFYKIPFPFIIKWPLILLSVGGGAALAFVPVAGRPFSQWLMAFFKAIYSPTEFTWDLTNTTPASPPIVGGDTDGSRRGGMGTSPLDKFEEQLFGKISQIFNSSHKPQTTISNEIPITKLQETMIEEVYTAPLIPTASKAIDVSTAPQQAQGIPMPTQANVLIGQLLNSNQMGIDGAIVEILNADTGFPVRALRSNRLGQFQIATPLANGKYVIEVEKAGLIFDPVTISTKGEIVAPILIMPKI